MDAAKFEKRMTKILQSELLRACHNGDQDAIAQLVDDKQTALDCVDESNGEQPLIIASKNGHFEIVKYILWHNTDILDNTDAAGWSALHFAILNGHYLITKELIEFGADLDLKSESDNIYPLHLSIFYNQPTICKLLLDNDCNLDILYNDMSIIEILDYLHFKSKQLSQFEVDRFKNIITNCHQYKTFKNKRHKKRKSDSINSTPRMIPTDDDENDDDDDDDDDDEVSVGSPFWKKYLTASPEQSAENEQKNKKKYVVHSDTDDDDDDDDGHEIRTRFDDEDDKEIKSSVEIKEKYAFRREVDSDHDHANDSDDAVGDIMNFLQKPMTDTLDLDHSSDDVIMEESQNENEDVKEMEIDKIHLDDSVVTDDDIEKREKNLAKEVVETNNVQIETKNDLKTESIATKEEESEKLFSSDSIISIDLNRLFDSIKHKFVLKSDFESFKQTQLNEQSQSLKEIIDVNEEINDLNVCMKQIKQNVDTLQNEMNETINTLKQQNDELIKNECNLLKESMENERNLWNETFGEKIKNETSEKLDSELTKYEIWLKTMLLFVEESIKKNENDIESMAQTQKFLILRMLKMNKPSIDTLKVGYFVENELKSTSSKSKSMSNITKNHKKNHKKRRHISTPSTPILGQSFTPMIGSLNQLRHSDDDSSEDDGIGHISPPHGRSNSLRINIQQNIYNAFGTKAPKKKNRRKKKRSSQSLKLIQQFSEPIKSSAGSQSDNDLEFENDDILCTIESPRDGSDKSKKKRKLRRKRSNSFSAESPSKLKLHAFSFKKTESYLE